MDAAELLPEPAEKLSDWNEENCKNIFKSTSKRDRGLEIVIGSELLNVFKNSKLFMIGAGAIGC